MISLTKDELVLHINNLDCQIEYLNQAVNYNMASEVEESRLNSLIVKRAHFRKDLEDLETNENGNLIFYKFKMFSRQPKRISDYF
ncbi:MAG: hypothetical protein AB1782_15445 [Cyanobacteriota bacterium]